ncbi:MAG: 2-keto-3-deoxy-phosphogluconate aldolase [Microbacteriaceae bacterium]|jgi:Entner-Doudoroff aldolase|nr:2-keto-3-deoxy-phosphogluconate aldolase [Microbacteriaceae bacterium]
MTATASNTWFDHHFAGQPLMAILRGFGTARSLELATTAWNLGIDIVEIPIQSPLDLEALAATAALGRERGKPVGAGTVILPAHVQEAGDAGAAFTVSPGLDPEIVRESLDAGLPTLPGVATASEIQRAVALGLDWVKAFPASALGPGWFSAMRGPFPGVKLVGTGGLHASNAGAFLEAGARVVAVGSALEDVAQLSLLARFLPARADGS